MMTRKSKNVWTIGFPKRWKLLVTGLIIIFLATLIPYPTEVIKPYSLLVTDENGNPIPGVEVTRRTSGGSLTHKEEISLTNIDGLAEFGSRHDFNNFLFRKVKEMVHIPLDLLSMGHTRDDVFISVSTLDSHVFRTGGFMGFYENQNPPAKLILQRRQQGPD